VLLDGHDLDGVVAQLADAGQHVLPELKVAVHLGGTTQRTAHVSPKHKHKHMLIQSTMLLLLLLSLLP
jgi:hypothetical protein